MKDFRTLKVWQRAHEFTLAVYRESKHFPSEELYGLTSQIRRASLSIPTNIAEGCGRDGDAEFSRFVAIAMGSASEVEYLLTLAHDLAYLEEGSYQNLNREVIEIKSMISGLYRRLRSGRKVPAADR